MHLNPVYLVAPKPKPPSVPTRRAFLIAGATFLAGAGLGGACGYAAGTSAVEGNGDAPFADALKPTGDSDLDELRRLAVKAPIEELTDKWFMFLTLLHDTYRNDATLWHGAERIIDEVLTNDGIKQRRKIAVWVLKVIEDGNPELRRNASTHAPALRMIK
tara:strand:- start:20918 stop:21397 length:480 start_codon:yes stop_codon:yes gene_type:complete